MLAAVDGDPLILGFKLVLVVGLVLLNGFFVAAEFSIVKIRDTQLETLVVEGHRRAKIARQVVGNLDAALSATQLGITLASLGLGWFAEPVFEQLLHPLLEWFNVASEGVRHTISATVGFLVITFMHIVAGELAPKSLAIQYPLPTSLWIARPLLWFYTVSFPFIWTLNHASNWLLRRFGIEPVSETEMVHSEDELRLLLTANQRSIGGPALSREIVLNSFDLRQRLAREIMRPRREIVAMNTNDPIETCMKRARDTRYSRFPLCENGDFDKTLGVIHFKDLFGTSDDAKTAGDLKHLARKLIFVPETARLDKMLQRFLDRRLHMALVVDEYGGTTGMVTLENILEEIVGEIEDEFDHEEPQLIKALDAESWEVDGLLPLFELSEKTGQVIREEGVATVGGWVTHQRDGFPKVGDICELKGYQLEVTRLEGPRVDKLVLHKVPDEDSDAPTS